MKSLFVAFTLLFSTTLFAADAPRPNILYFYVDDMGWGSIGPNGQAERRAKGLPTVKTPNLDKLAAQGVNFTRAYGCTVCSPARSSQQTGFHQGHTFADRNDPDNAMKAIRKDDVTMGDALAAADYMTGYWGKWGYGGSKDMENPVIENVQTLPTSHGYQHVLCELHHVRAHTFFQPTLWKAPGKRQGG
ncbi:MAG: sulfatase-like hydrolase/transferase, partial [Verrucomicrobiales bacterium]|nr:sulfatase-like hydrolase/transferase [Verrucomicrobiales bacterium]